jgi:hypothetical protein
MSEVGKGPTGRPRFAYCEASNEDEEAHVPDPALLAARDLLELLDSRRADDHIAEYGNALSRYSPEKLAELRGWLKELIAIRAALNWDSKIEI